jgi:hypothetical protein
VKVTLPSKNWVELRDRLMAADRFAVQDAVILTITGADKQEIGAGITNRMRNALLCQIITGWSFEGTPIPAMNASPGTDILGSTLDIDDYNHLADKVQHLLDKVSFNPNPPATSGSKRSS